jgi:hypothetical protein
MLTTLSYQLDRLNCQSDCRSSATNVLRRRGESDRDSAGVQRLLIERSESPHVPRRLQHREIKIGEIKSFLDRSGRGVIHQAQRRVERPA